MVVIFILLVAALAYFNIDLKTLVESEPVQAIWGFVETLWTNFVGPAIDYIWNNILHDFIYQNVVDFFTQAQQQISDTTIDSLISTTTPSTN